MQAFLDGVVVSAYTQTLLQVKVSESKFPIPRHLAGFSVPKNIQKYITEMYPYLTKCLCMKRVFNPEQQTDLIAEFTIFMLETNQKGVPRYKTYNPKKYPDIPYYRWFLFQMGWILLKQNAAQAKLHQKEKYVLSLSGDAKDAYSPETRKLGIVCLEFIPAKDLSIPDLVALKQIPDFLKKYKEQHSRPETCSKNFANHVDYLFEAQMSNRSKTECAEKIGVPRYTLSKWVRNLQALIADFLQIAPAKA